MARDRWFRNTEWSHEIENAFFSKLSRARSQRDQYLVIQANTLHENHPAITLKLVDYYFETKHGEVHDVLALLARARALVTLDRIDSAMNAYRAVLDREREYPKQRTTTWVDYPYLVATRAIEAEFGYARHTLDDPLLRLPVLFPVDRYMWHAAKALIDNDPIHAKQALAAAKTKSSGYKYHPRVGLVSEEHANTVAKLTRLAKTADS